MNGQLHRLLPVVLAVSLAALALPAAAQAPAAATGESPAPPPIDCPLHGKHVEDSSMRPIEEVDAYIAYLDSPERAAWQKPDDVVAALGLEGDETVVDLGAGGGYFTFRIAPRLPRGRVIASDIEPEMVRHIHHRAMTEGIGNVRAKLIEPSDPDLPAGVDLVFICNVLHHVADRPAWLDKLSGAMRPGTRVVVLEFREGELPKGPPPAMKIPKAEILELLEAAGLALAEENPDLLPYQYYLVFEKP